MRAAFQVSQVVIAITMVVSPLLETMLSSGVLLRTPAVTPGSASCTTPMAMWAGTATLRRSVLPSAASGIDYLSI